MQYFEPNHTASLQYGHIKTLLELNPVQARSAYPLLVLYMTVAQSQESSAVLLTTKDCCKILGVNIKSIIKARKLLLNAGFITDVRDGKHQLVQLHYSLFDAEHSKSLDQYPDIIRQSIWVFTDRLRKASCYRTACMAFLLEAYYQHISNLRDTGTWICSWDTNAHKDLGSSSTALSKARQLLIDQKRIVWKHSTTYHPENLPAECPWRPRTHVRLLYTFTAETIVEIKASRINLEHRELPSYTKPKRNTMPTPKKRTVVPTPRRYKIHASSALYLSSTRSIQTKHLPVLIKDCTEMLRTKMTKGKRMMFEAVLERANAQHRKGFSKMRKPIGIKKKAKSDVKLSLYAKKVLSHWNSMENLTTHKKLNTNIIQKFNAMMPAVQSGALFRDSVYSKSVYTDTKTIPVATVLEAVSNLNDFIGDVKQPEAQRKFNRTLNIKQFFRVDDVRFETTDRTDEERSHLWHPFLQWRTGSSFHIKNHTTGLECIVPDENFKWLMKQSKSMFERRGLDLSNTRDMNACTKCLNTVFSMFGNYEIPASYYDKNEDGTPKYIFGVADPYKYRYPEIRRDWIQHLNEALDNREFDTGVLHHDWFYDDVFKKLLKTKNIPYGIGESSLTIDPDLIAPEPEPEYSEVQGIQVSAYVAYILDPKNNPAVSFNAECAQEIIDDCMAVLEQEPGVFMKRDIKNLTSEMNKILNPKEEVHENVGENWNG